MVGASQNTMSERGSCSHVLDHEIEGLGSNDYIGGQEGVRSISSVPRYKAPLGGNGQLAACIASRTTGMGGRYEPPALT